MMCTRVCCAQSVRLGLVLAGALAISLPAMAWEPTDAGKTSNPGWYRAGETVPYFVPRPATAPGYSGASLYPGYTSPYPGDRGSDWNRDSADSGYGAGNADGYSGGYQWAQPGTGVGQDQPADVWNATNRPGSTVDQLTPNDQAGFGAGGENPAYWRGAPGYPGYGSSADAALGGYRFRDDPQFDTDWQAPAGSWGGEYGGYRFRDDTRFESGMPAAVDPRYRFRPLEPEGSSLDSSANSSRRWQGDGSFSQPWSR